MKKIHMHRVLFFLLATHLTGAGSTAIAQRSWDYSWGYSATMQYYTNKAAQKARRRSGSGSTKPAKAPPYNPYPNKGKTTFTPVGDRNFRIYLMADEAGGNIDWSQHGATDVHEATKMRHALHDQLTQLFKQSLATYDRQTRTQKVPLNDVAATLTRCISLNYRLATGKTLTSTQQSRLRAQSRAALLADPKFREMSDEAKQTLHEQLIVGTMPAVLGYEQAVREKNNKRQQQFRQMAEKNLTLLTGVPIAKIKSQGAAAFVP